MEAMKEMSVEKHFPKKLRDQYEIHQWKHACAILKSDFPNEWKDLIDMLSNFHLLKSWIVKGGGNKTELAKWIRRHIELIAIKIELLLNLNGIIRIPSLIAT